MSLRVAIIGMGGFAGHHHDVVKRLEEEGRCRLACTCDPDPAAFAERAENLRFEERSVAFLDDYLKMLDTYQGRLDLVTIPTPVPLHAPMHRACVERGLPVYLEKPPTLSYEELEEMLAVESGARMSTNVGFNYIVEAERLALKRRILDGEFGKVRRVSLLGLSSRAKSYYARTPWAGRLMLDRRLVLDSCFGNAMAHLAHNVLFWAGGGDVLSWADVEEVEAELYRGHEIEGFDTVFARTLSSGGVEILVAMSHACEESGTYREVVTCDKATISYSVLSEYRIEGVDGTVESGRVAPVTLRENLLAHLDYIEGRVDRPVTRLMDCRPFVAMNSLLYVAAGNIHTIPSDCLICSGDADQAVAIGGLTAVSEEFLASGRLPPEQGVAWSRGGGRAEAGDVHKLLDVVTGMVGRD